MKLISTAAANALSIIMFVSPLSAQEKLPQCCLLVELKACFDACFDNAQQCTFDPTDDTCKMQSEAEIDSCEAVCREHELTSCIPGTNKLRMKELLNENLCTMTKEE